MNPSHTCSFTVSGDRPPSVEFDPSATAFYVRFSDAKVAKTIPRMEQPTIVNLDLDADGQVVGIESLGANNLSINALLSAAGVSAPKIDFGNAILRRTGSPVLA